MKIAFVFSGQGAQYTGMAKELCENFASCASIMNIADETLGRNISKLCFDEDLEKLSLTHNTQPCVLAADIVAAQALIDNGITPEAVAGFSLGEYAALHMAGVLDTKAVFPLIQLRADAMQEAVPVGMGAMAAIMSNGETVEKLCGEVIDGYAVPANYNSPKQTVVSGDTKGIENIVKLANEQGIRAVQLSVSAPFHCNLLKPAADKLKEKLDDIELGECKLPVYMNYTANSIKNNADVKELLYLQAFNAVRWEQTIKNMCEDGIDTFIECGPGQTLSGFIKRINKEVRCLHVEDMQTLQETIKALQQ